MVKYTFTDLRQASIGAFMAIIIFFAIRGKNPFFFNPNYGIIISILIVWIYYNSFNGKFKRENFIIDLIVAFVICAIMAYIFSLITYEELLSKKVFGSLVIIGWWVAIPLALLFDKFNFTNPLKRYYIRGK